MANSKRQTPQPQTAARPMVLEPVYLFLDIFGFHSIREAVDALVGALILALLFRAFDAEAFRIPTGSMAPTLLGHHKDVECKYCHYPFTVSASSEIDESGRGTKADVTTVTCPQCRATIDVNPAHAEGRQYGSYPGDRILVGKATYQFSGPQRWDVAVFKNPMQADQNYIKRIVGLPEETVRLSHGDIFVKPADESTYRRPERDPAKLKAMAQIVYDNDYVTDFLTKHGWPVRWQPWPADSAGQSGHWTTSDGSRSFSIDGTASEERWLRYRHFTPSLSDWKRLSDGPLPANYPVSPRLITDFYAYDAGSTRVEGLVPADLLGAHWVGDLLLECELTTSKAAGIVTLDLVKGGRHLQCQLKLDDGAATLSIDGVDDFSPSAKTALNRPGKHQVRFANVDQKLTLWVDGNPVEFDASTAYPDLHNDQPRTGATDPGDLAPAGISSQGAAVRVNHLRLWRDIYYIAVEGSNQPLNDFKDRGRVALMNYDELLALWTDPAKWDPPDEPSPFDDMAHADFPLAANQFFVLGDNSPKSLDARAWLKEERYVRRDLIVGKALFIFWPRGSGVVPLAPDFTRIGFIR